MAGEYGPREKWTKAPPSTSLWNREEKSDADRGNFARPRRLQFQGFSRTRRRRRTNPTSGGTSDGYHALAQKLAQLRNANSHIGPKTRNLICLLFPSHCFATKK